MAISNYPLGFPAGLIVRNMPLAVAHPGSVFWVNSSRAGGKGTFQRPYATINDALSQCVAGRGDVILAGPGHVDTITAAGGISIAKSGVALVGLGSGSLRPTINFTTVVGADLNIDAANVSISNFLFTGGIDALTGPIDVNAADCTLADIETRDVTGQATDFIVTDANANRLKISGWVHRGAAAAGADTAISMVGGADIIIEDFEIYGNFAVGGIENVTTAANRIRIGGGAYPCFIWTENANDIAITLVAGASGHIGPNINIMLQDNAANITEAINAAGCQFFQPINIVNLAGESSMQTNITASTDA